LIHDRVASTWSLARVVLGSIYPKTTHTPVQNESLKLIINTLVELGTPAIHQKIASEGVKTVEGMIAPAMLDERKTGWV
jgi:hypothetical protein